MKNSFIRKALCLLGTCRTLALLGTMLLGSTLYAQSQEPTKTKGDKPVVIRCGTPTPDSTEPLCILDGTVISKELMQQIAPTDIKQMTVLKDKEATALYGSAAAKGAIVIQSLAAEAPEVKARISALLAQCQGAEVGMPKTCPNNTKGLKGKVAGIKNKTGADTKALEGKLSGKVADIKGTPKAYSAQLKDDALYMVDGKVITKEEAKALPAEQIESISVVKPKFPVHKDSLERATIVITMKKK